MSLEEYRKEIDGLDEELLKILSRRQDVVRKIGAYKKAKALPVLDLERKRQVLQRFTDTAAALGLGAEFAKRVYELIHEEAIREEEKV